VERPESTVSLGQEVQANGILVGRVTDSGGDPVPNASVRILSGQFDVGGPVLRMDRGGVIVSTNESGYYRACWMPVDSPLDVAVLDPDETDPSDVEAASLLTEEQEVILSPASPLGRLDLRINPM